MDLIGEQLLLRLFLRNTDQYHLAPLHERIVQKARRSHLAGATVLHGILGFGRRGLTRAAPGHWHNDAPVVVELVDRHDRLLPFAREVLPTMVHHARATLERAGVMLYRHRHHDAPPAMTLPPGVPPLANIPTWEDTHMLANSDGTLLRIFIGESDVRDGRPLYEAIVTRARELGLAGATVFRGSMGFGANSMLHTQKILALSTDLPIVIEIADTDDKINTLLPELDTLIKDGLVTSEAVRVLLYRRDEDTHHTPE